MIEQIKELIRNIIHLRALEDQTRILRNMLADQLFGAPTFGRDAKLEITKDKSFYIEVDGVTYRLLVPVSEGVGCTGVEHVELEEVQMFKEEGTDTHS